MRWMVKSSPIGNLSWWQSGYVDGEAETKFRRATGKLGFNPPKFDNDCEPDYKVGYLAAWQDFSKTIHHDGKGKAI